MARNFDQLPLRERLKHAEQLSRELVEHLEQGFIPKLEACRRVTRQSATESTTDQTVRDHAATVLRSEEFTEQVFEKLNGCLNSITSELRTIIGAAE